MAAYSTLKTGKISDDLYLCDQLKQFENRFLLKQRQYGFKKQTACCLNAALQSPVILLRRQRNTQRYLIKAALVMHLI